MKNSELVLYAQLAIMLLKSIVLTHCSTASYPCGYEADRVVPTSFS